MKMPPTALAFVIAVVVAGGVLGALRPEIAVAACLSIVALGGTLLILTSRPAPAPVGFVPRRSVRAAAEGIVVRAAAGSGRCYAQA